MKSLFPLLGLCLSVLICTAQDKSVHRELDKKLLQQPDYYKIPGKGVVVCVRSTDKAGKNSTMNFEFEYYDAELNKKWTWSKYEKVPFKWMDTQLYRCYGDALNGRFNLDGTYTNFLFYEAAGNKVYKIDLATGESQSVELSQRTSFEYYDLEAYADDDYFYVIYTNSSNKQDGEEPGFVELFRIEIETMKEKFGKIEIPPAGKKNTGGEARRWIPMGAYKNNLYFKNSYLSVGDGESHRQLIRYNLKTKEVRSTYVLVGERNTVYIGDVKFNKLKDGQFYSFCTMTKGGKRTAYFSCLDQNLNELWNKKYETGGGNGAATKIVGGVVVEEINNNLIISSSLGLDRFSLKYSPDSQEFKYADSEKYKKEVDIPFKYDLAVSTYMDFKEHPKVKAYVDRDMKKNSDNVRIETLYTDKGIILIKDVSSTKPYVQMDLFRF